MSETQDKPQSMPPVPPFVKFVAAAVPMVFDDSLSYYEALCALWKYISGMTDVINNNATLEEEYIEKFDELKEFVDHYFDNLDVQEEINNKLDEMAEDGTLEEIIENYLQPYIDKYEKFTNSFVQNKITSEYIATRYKLAGTATTMDSTIPHEMEGICHVGNDKVIVFYSPASSSITVSSNVVVEEIDLSGSTPTVNRQSTISGLMHANSCCFNISENKIYVALAQYYDGATVYSNKVTVLNYSNFSVDRTVTFSSLTDLTKICYDSINDKYYGISSSAMYELNMSDGSSTKLFDIDSAYTSGSQGLEIRNGKFYLMKCYPHQIVVINIDGTVEKEISVDEFDNIGHGIEYFADITFVDDENILLTPHCTGDYVNYSRYQYSVYINYINKLNIFGNNVKMPTSDQLSLSNVIFIDTRGTIEDTTKANGTSDYPFKSLQEVLRNKFFTTLCPRLNSTDSSTITYKGSLILDNFKLGFDSAFECEGIKMRNSELASGNITCNSLLIDIEKSTIKSPKMYLKYSGDDYHQIAYSDIRIPEIYTTSTNTAKIELNSSQIIKYNNTYKSKIQSPLDVVQSTLSVSGTTLTVDFSNYVTNTGFSPNAYILGLNLTTPAESITYLRCQGLGNNRNIKDSAGNLYTFTTYNASTKSLTITGSNVSNIAVVTMIVL